MKFTVIFLKEELMKIILINLVLLMLQVKHHQIILFLHMYEHLKFQQLLQIVQIIMVPRQHPEKLIPKLIYNILNNIPLPIYGDGKNSREWIFVEDHCEALFKVLKKVN